MVQLQILNKVLDTQDFSIIEKNLIGAEYFTEYPNEFRFIKAHYDKYGNVPDKATFISEFKDFSFIDVAESDGYLIDTLREEHLFHNSVPVLQTYADLLKEDANKANEYLQQQIKALKPVYGISGTDLIKSSGERLERFRERKKGEKTHCFTTGFQELDDLINGIERDEELFVIVARTNQGKSWMLEKIGVHIWEIGYNVGYVSPEMKEIQVGYRFDTLMNNFSNSDLMYGKEGINEVEYEEYINKLQERHNKFLVATREDFGDGITVSKLKQFVSQNNLDLLAIDGITFLKDERGRRNDNLTTTLSNLSDDLHALSLELSVPIIVVVQANRNGIKDNGEAPSLEDIRDSDGIAHNATKVLSITQKKDVGVLELCVKKNRYGTVNSKLLYRWDINLGDFQYIPSYDDAQPKEKRDEAIRTVKNRYKDKCDVF